MLLAVTICVFVALGAALARGMDAGPLERATAALTIGTALWLASAWTLALAHLLTREMLLIRTGVAAVAWLVLKAEGKRETSRTSRFPLLPSAFCVLPFIAFILWRGWVTPPLSHDALTYHLPKALLWMRAHGFVYPAGLDASLRQLPANYEMLLAEVLALDGSDRVAEWVTTFFSIAFVVACAAVAERWWGRSRAVATAVIVAVASAPALLLQSGSVKNDAMTAFFMVAMFVWGGRFWRSGETSALLLLLVAGAAGTGTKPQAGILCIALAPFVIRKLAASFDRRKLALAAAVAVVSFALLGGAVYVSNYTHRIGAMDLALEKPASRARPGSLTWGDWRNLWEGPWVLVYAPLSPTADKLYVPGYAERWFWRRYELYFSHLGLTFTMAVVLLPLAIARLRSHRGGGGLAGENAGSERAIVSLAALATFVAMLPVVFYPHGLYDIGLPRYVFFLLPVVYGWTLAPAVLWLETARPLLARFTRAALALWFLLQAAESMLLDAFSPLEYVIWAARHPGTRMIPFDPRRAASVADRDAPPGETIAVEVSPGAWIYPAYGAHLDRNVVLLPPGTGPDAVPPGVQWVAIDHANSLAWADPHFTDLSRWREAGAHDVISDADFALFRRYGTDRRFRTIEFDKHTAQGVFRRIR